MHVTMCPRLSLMYAIPLVFGLNTLNIPITLNTLITLIIPNTLITPIPHSKERACPKAHPQTTLNQLARYQTLGLLTSFFLYSQLVLSDSWHAPQRDGLRSCAIVFRSPEGQTISQCPCGTCHKTCAYFLWPPSHW